MKLAQAKPAPVVHNTTKSKPEEIRPLDEGLSESVDDHEDEDINVYGLAKDHPDYPVMKRRLQLLKRSDPTLYKKIHSLD